MPSINGQSILVIGGSSGIGAAVAKLAAAQGVHVSIASSNATRVADAVKAIKTAVPDAQIAGYTCNINSDDVEVHLEKLMSDVTTSTGAKLDHIVYTANALNLKPLADLTVDYLRGSAQFGLVAPLLIAKMAPRFLNQSYRSSLIFTSGRVGDKPAKGYTVEAAWAAGLSGLTRSLALDLAPIRVNLVSPGSTNTEMWGSDEVRAQIQVMMEKTALLGKVGTAEEVGEAYIYLMKDSNNTGSCINTNGAFTVAIGAIAIGDPGPAAGALAEAEAAAKAISEAAKSAECFIKPETIKFLKESIEALSKLWEGTNQSIGEITEQAYKPISEIDLTPGGGDVAGNGQGNADLTAIASLAAWDRWMLETDDQMSFAVDKEIEGASDYLLELRKYDVDGKLLTQARAQAVKTGEEYLQLWLQLRTTEQNQKHLEDLLAKYDGEQELAVEAQNHFYDCLAVLRTTIMINLRNEMWAYKYYALADSSVVLDPSKSIREYRQYAQTLVEDLKTCLEKYTSDAFQHELPIGYAEAIVESLKTTGTARFTLSPVSAVYAKNDLISVPGPFSKGSRIRIYGMRAFLLGVDLLKPNTKNTLDVEVWISTTGVYTDVQNGQIFGFIIKPMHRKLHYTQKKGARHQFKAAVDSIYKSQDFVDPTPFAQWTIELSNWRNYDLEKLTGVRFYWEGTANYN